MEFFKRLIYISSILILLTMSAMAVDIDSLDPDFESSAGTPANITVLVTYAGNSTPINNTLVNFTTDLGVLSSSSALSNASGIAEVLLNSTIAGSAHLNVSSGDSYVLTNGTIHPLETSSYSVYANKSVNIAGNVTNITFYPHDIYGNTNTSELISVNVRVKDIFGSLLHDVDIPLYAGNKVLLETNKTSYDTSYLSAPYDYGVLHINSTIAGTIYIDSSAASFSNSTVLSIDPAPPDLMRISYNADYTVNTSSNLNVIVYDRYSNPIENAMVLFNVSSPDNTVSNSPVAYDSAYVSHASGLTDIYGQLSNSFTTDKRSGNNIIGISVANSSLQHNITISGIADNIDKFFLNKFPAAAIANNIDYYTLSAQPVDQFLNPVVPLTSSIGKQVRFTTPTSSILMPLNYMGQATTKVGPTPYVESVPVTATFRNESGYTSFINSTTLNFTADVLDSIDMYAIPNAVLDNSLDGNHNSTITVVALDQWGHALPDIPIVLNNTNTSTGTLRVDGIGATDHINASTGADGRLYATFTGNVSGNTSIIATTDNMTIQANVTVKDEPFLSVSFFVEPPTIDTGSVVNVTTVISVEGELPIVRPTASAMLVLDRSGSMDPDYYAGEPLDVVLVMDRSGSMSGTPISDAKTAAKSFVDHLTSNAQVGLVSFAGSSSTDLGLTHLNSYSNNTLAHTSIDSIQDGGSTAMGEGMGDANDILIDNGRLSSKKAMIVLTDGNTNAGEDQRGDNAINDALANGITIYTIGLGNNLDESLLQYIAAETGGKYYNAPTSSELKTIYASIAQELSDYDAVDVEFGTDGFTPYDHAFHDTLEMNSSLSEKNVTLQFEGYDFDVVFDAGSNYGGASAGEALIQLNGENFTLIPSSNTGVNRQWEDYQYDLSGLLNPVSNKLSFYDYYHLIKGSGYDGAVRNIEIVWQAHVLAQSSSSVQLTDVSYDFLWDIPYFDDSYSETFLINESINDIKVQLDWENSSNDLSLILTSPSGHVYSKSNDSRGYYAEDSNTEYIWVRPVFTTYPEDDVDTVEMGNWTVDVMGFGEGTEDFTITTYIDKKSATQLSSHAFMTSFDEERGDKAGMAIYSFEGEELSNTQSSYVLDNSTWLGYFTAQEDGYYTFDVSWSDASQLDASLYDGADLVASSNGSTGIEVSKTLVSGETYHIDISKSPGSMEDTYFTIDVSKTILDNVMAAYFDTSGDGSTPKYRLLEEGASWSAEKYAEHTGGWPYLVELESNPLNSEIILCTGNDFFDLKAQVWDGEDWGDIYVLSENLGSKPHIDTSVDYYTRNFDIEYEQTSGDALAVYMDTSVSNNTPLYSLWDGSSWNNGTAIEGFNSTGNGSSVEWIELAADPGSDDMVLMSLDSEGKIYGSVWDGSSWDEFVELATNASQDGFQCFDVVYEQDSGRAMVSWYDQSGSVNYRIWNGDNLWKSENTLYASTEHVYWIKMAGRPGSDELLLATQDEHHDVHVTAWDGNSWETPLEVGTNVYEANRRSVDVAFESSSGEGIVVWGDRSRISKYRTWDGSTWSPEASANNLGSGYTRWVQMRPLPESDEIFLMTSDGGHDINVQKWDGSSWVYIFEMEVNSKRYFESFDLVIDDKDNTVTYPDVQWNQWTAKAASTFENDSLVHLESVIDSITADGLTAIDEGLHVANNELSSSEDNSTILIMSDGMDNAGYHSLLEEAYRAKGNNSVIYTVGFGNDESEVDPMLEEIADITGGEYYFAPNSSVLKDIFRGIAADITNFSASGTAMNIDIPKDYVSQLSIAEASYISGSSNSTVGNESYFETPTSPPTANAEPAVSEYSDRKRLQWYLPNLGSGDKWGLWYQLKLEGAGYIPIILPTSSVTYTDLESELVTVTVPSVGGASLGGVGANFTIPPLGSLTLDPEDRIMLIDNKTSINVTVKGLNGSLTGAYVHLYTNVGYFNNYSNPVNISVVGSNSVNFSSAVAGKAYITGYAYNVNNVSDVLVASETLVVRPKGMISIS